MDHTLNIVRFDIDHNYVHNIYYNKYIMIVLQATYMLLINSTIM